MPFSKLSMCMTSNLSFNEDQVGIGQKRDHQVTAFRKEGHSCIKMARYTPSRGARYFKSGWHSLSSIYSILSIMAKAREAACDKS